MIWVIDDRHFSEVFLWYTFWLQLRLKEVDWNGLGTGLDSIGSGGQVSDLNLYT